MGYKGESVLDSGYFFHGACDTCGHADIISKMPGGLALCDRCHANTVENSWIITGRRHGKLWTGLRRQHVVGRPDTVEFDAEWTIERHKSRGDVLGWYHTHPPGCPAYVSDRDLRTMRAWVGCLGRPLVCLIEGSQGLRAWEFEHDESNGIPLKFARVIGNRFVGITR